jgi:hypothetical protein
MNLKSQWLFGGVLTFILLNSFVVNKTKYNINAND